MYLEMECSINNALNLRGGSPPMCINHGFRRMMLSSKKGKMAKLEFDPICQGDRLVIEIPSIRKARGPQTF